MSSEKYEWYRPVLSSPSSSSSSSTSLEGRGLACFLLDMLVTARPQHFHTTTTRTTRRHNNKLRRLDRRRLSRKAKEQSFVPSCSYLAKKLLNCEIFFFFFFGRGGRESKSGNFAIGSVSSH